MDSGTLKLFGILVFMGIMFAGITKYVTQRGMDGLEDYADRAVAGEIDPEEQLKRIEEIWVPPPPPPEPTNAPLYALIGFGGLLVVAAPLAFRKIQAMEAEELAKSRAAAVEVVKARQAEKKASEEREKDEGQYTPAPVTRLPPQDGQS